MDLRYLPAVCVKPRLEHPQTDLPRIAKDSQHNSRYRAGRSEYPNQSHDLAWRRSTRRRNLKMNSVHLVVTSPPYWILKEYPDIASGQLGNMSDYELLPATELDQVWHECFRVRSWWSSSMRSRRRMLARRRQKPGCHTVVPLHAAIQERCRTIGDNLAPISATIANASRSRRTGPGSHGSHMPLQRGNSGMTQ